MRNIQESESGFGELARVYHQALAHLESRLVLDMRQVRFLSAGMCAPLSAILARLEQSGKHVQIANLQLKVRRILQKNGFLQRFGLPLIFDTFGTTIPARTFMLEDSQLADFTNFLDEQFLGRAELPRMSNGVKHRLKLSLCEVFQNAQLHSQSGLGVHCCGQWFPNLGKLHFTLADAGVGIKANVQERLGREIGAADAISWAMVPGHTTRQGSIPGGAGLGRLQEFVSMNGGELALISSGGYWSMSRDQVRRVTLEKALPGLTVHFVVNTSDTNSYALKDELDLDNVL